MIIVYDYEHIPKACVSGYNLKLYNAMSVEECKAKCNEISSCLAFEYGTPYGGDSDHFKPKDCHLQSGANPENCDGVYYNLDLYVKTIHHQNYVV